MNRLAVFTLKVLRKLYACIIRKHPYLTLSREEDPNKISDMIYKLLSDDKPCMIARFGSTELTTIVNYLGVKKDGRNIVKYIKGEAPAWWWNQNIIEQMQRWSGFFPPTHKNIEQFCELMLEDAKEVDVLGSWIPQEYYLRDFFVKASKVHLRLIEPFWTPDPWTRILKGKRILIVHPFSETILGQYENRDKLFSNPNILPEFASLQVIKAVQSLGGESHDFKDWFEALEYMKKEINKCDYDICLIGCGAYGFPLAAHVKRQGKQAVHLGGSLQLLFGIKGKRWEDPNYGIKEWGIPYGSYSSLINEYWVRPNQLEKPRQSEQVESACYW